ncbi:hypothetical protein [Sinosporangium siamense]|uniref:hypothetical protein n=1 Tax=Sinosporangium siamense TaxID=1367973 RepID=UPI00194F0778|nr:hypothetical protein [Sinosporangium siamense]
MVMTLWVPPAESAFAAISSAVQRVMSVLVPHLGILRMHGQRQASPAQLVSGILSASLWAAALGAFGTPAVAVALPEAAAVWSQAGPSW